MRTGYACLIVLLGLTAATAAAERAGEKLDRGLIARPAGEGKVYLSWRLLASDPDAAAFNVYRRVDDQKPIRINDEPIRQTTDFVDAEAPGDKDCAWVVRLVAGGNEEQASEPDRLPRGDRTEGYIPIKLQGDYTFQKVGVADLDGDQRYDYVIKQPADNIDPYDKYWKPSPDTYKLEAYSHDGRFLWRHDLGWAIERGIWYSPYVVYDLNGDGRAEVAVKTGEGDPRDSDGRVKTGPEYLSILDGRTGETITRIDWPSRAGYGGNDGGYNRSCRNQLLVAYLDGKTPALIVNRGTYDLIRFVAYRLDGNELRELWRWDTDSAPEYKGQGAHWMHAADVDADGRDEIVFGSAVLDDDGKPLWKTGLGHPDHLYVGDIDPERPGLEIYFGIETRRKNGNGMCLVDAKTGEIIWGIKEPTQHVHGQGMAGDIDANHPGSECYSAESNPAAGKSLAWARLFTAKGEVISEEVMGGFNPDTVCWDADPQRELVLKNRIVNYGSDEAIGRIEGNLVAVADVLGDWREEIITSVKGEMRIYTTTIPASDRRVCLMQDPLYRLDVVAAAMGYYQVPMTSYDLATE